MTPEEGLKAVDKFKEKEVQIVLLDTVLVPGNSEGDESRKILEKIRKVAPEVKVISFSSDDILEGTDSKLTKDFSREELISSTMPTLDSFLSERIQTIANESIGSDNQLNPVSAFGEYILEKDGFQQLTDVACNHLADSVFQLIGEKAKANAKSE